MSHLDGTADTTSYGVKGENTSPPQNPLFVPHWVTGNPPTTGVWGDAPNYSGVTGTSANGTGVYGNGFYALRGDSSNGNGFIGGIDPKFQQKAGVYGSSPNQGVIGATDGGHGTAIYGDSTDGFAIRGDTTTGTAVQGTASAGGLAAKFNGNVQFNAGDINVSGRVLATGDVSGARLLCYGGGGAYVEGDATVTGRVLATGDVSGARLLCYGGGGAYVEGDITVTRRVLAHDVVLSNSDCAEDFDIADTNGAEPGTVMVLDDAGSLRPNEAAYDKRVVGVISGAGPFKPGIILGRLPSERKRMPIALLGKVYCKVDGDYAPVEVGDLLTTSPTRGHAMKAMNPDLTFGSVIGKALRGLECGRGVIPILVVLQ